jgi:hypothetical protein
VSDKPNDLEVVDPSGLTDADWADINRLKKLYETGGRDALSKALAELGESDPVRSMRVLHALFPNTVREALKDSLAEEGITEEELRELIRKHQGSKRPGTVSS